MSALTDAQHGVRIRMLEGRLTDVMHALLHLRENSAAAVGKLERHEWMALTAQVDDMLAGRWDWGKRRFEAPVKKLTVPDNWRPGQRFDLEDA